MKFYENNYELRNHQDFIIEYVPNFDPFEIKKNCTTIQWLLSIIGVILWIISDLNLYFFWIPMLISVLIASFIETVSMYTIPMIIYNIRKDKVDKEKEQKELLKRMENLKKESEKKVFNVEFCKEILSHYKNLRIVENHYENFNEVLLALENLLFVVEKTNYDITKYESLFTTILSDIYQVVSTADSDFDSDIKTMLISMKEYIVSEIEMINRFPEMRVAASISAYTDMFKSKTYKGEFQNDL